MPIVIHAAFSHHLQLLRCLDSVIRPSTCPSYTKASTVVPSSVCPVQAARKVFHFPWFSHLDSFPDLDADRRQTRDGHLHRQKLTPSVTVTGHPHLPASKFACCGCVVGRSALGRAFHCSCCIREAPGKVSRSQGAREHSPTSKGQQERPH